MAAVVKIADPYPYWILNHKRNFGKESIRAEMFSINRKKILS
jgi:hypothetical protein